MNKNKLWPALLIGLTGNIAAGKSRVASIFASHGWTIFYADEWARKAVTPGSKALNTLKNFFGNHIMNESENLDRNKLLHYILASEKNKKKIEDIIHPEVFRLMDLELTNAGQNGVKKAVVEIPLLFETHLENCFDKIVLVTAPREERLKRLIKRNGIDRETADKWVSLQMSQEKKISRSDFVISNNSSYKTLEYKISSLLSNLNG